MWLLQNIYRFWASLTGAYSYTVAYVDFFDNEIKQRNGDWKGVLDEYLYATSEPIINGLTGGRR